MAGAKKKRRKFDRAAAERGVAAGKRAGRVAKALEPLAQLSKALGKNRNAPIPTRAIRRDVDPIAKEMGLPSDRPVRKKRKRKRRVEFDW